MPGRLRELVLRASLSAARRVSGRVWISLEPEQAWEPLPRYGWGRPSHPGLLDMLGEHNDRYRWIFEAIRRHGPDLRAIPRTSDDPTVPVWDYEAFSGLDLAALYALIRDRRPRRYVEIGSGNSTRVAARAARDGGQELEIVSIDPDPRLPVDALCSRVVRRRLEDASADDFGTLEAGDVLFLDGSHRILPGNDVTTFFCDVLPVLPAGVVVGVHDVYLPDDYPEVYLRHFFSEQYLLAAALLFDPEAGPGVLLPAHHLCVTSGLDPELHAAWQEAGLDGISAYGNAFWWVTRGRQRS